MKRFKHMVLVMMGLMLISVAAEADVALPWKRYTAQEHFSRYALNQRAGSVVRQEEHTDCPDLAGEYTGECRSSAGETIPVSDLLIEQDGCRSFRIADDEWAVGILKTSNDSMIPVLSVTELNQSHWMADDTGVRTVSVFMGSLAFAPELVWGVASTEARLSGDQLHIRALAEIRQGEEVEKESTECVLRR